MSPVPPITKEKPEPECYKLETNARTRHYWLLPSRYDPKNALLANWAPWVASLEWAAIIAFFLFLPNVCGPSGPDYPTLILIPGTCGMFACWGYRGMVSGHVRRIGSVVLFFTNAPVFLFYTVIVLTQWWQYR
ncbi:MAG TPA: hypothetical protein VLE43_01175 [Candidatus Saccharimonadia bacterium]|nr:hypothetical protein [Candidatus Saccharimonadia bacterium]